MAVLSPAQPLPHRRGINLKAVVVDDDDASARAVGVLLEQAGCRVAVCTDAEAAIEMALEPGVDLVSLDLRMPRLDGYEVLALIRSHEHTRRAPSVPVVAITGSVTGDDKARALASGFAGHLGKPIAADDLGALLGSVAALRGGLYRTRYTVDLAAITGRLEHVLGAARGDAAQAAAGIALALEQQGTELLHRMLASAYGHGLDAAAAAARRLADVGSAIGAGHFASLCASFEAALAGESLDFERPAVLARAELDRVVFTLRERVLP